MKLCKCIFIWLTLMITLCSCVTPDKSADIYEQIYEKYKNINSYRCIIVMTVTSNKTVREYSACQYYKFPDKYRMEILQPEDIRGLVTIYLKDQVTTIQPAIQGKFTILDFKPVDKSFIFLPDFFKTFYQSEQVAVSAANNGGSRYTVLNATTPGSNVYRFSQSLWIDNETLLPWKLEVYDIKNRPIISVLYEDIQLNSELEDKLFEVGG